MGVTGSKRDYQALGRKAYATRGGYARQRKARAQGRDPLAAANAARVLNYAKRLRAKLEALELPADTTIHTSNSVPTSVSTKVNTSNSGSMQRPPRGRSRQLPL